MSTRHQRLLFFRSLLSIYALIALVPIAHSAMHCPGPSTEPAYDSLISECRAEGCGCVPGHPHAICSGFNERMRAEPPELHHCERVCTCSSLTMSWLNSNERVRGPGRGRGSQREWMQDRIMRERAYGNVVRRRRGRNREQVGGEEEEEEELVAVILTIRIDGDDESESASGSGTAEAGQVDIIADEQCQAPCSSREDCRQGSNEQEGCTGDEICVVRRERELTPGASRFYTQGHCVPGRRPWGKRDMGGKGGNELWSSNVSRYGQAARPHEWSCACNQSYVSHTCCESVDGVVFENHSDETGFLE